MAATQADQEAQVGLSLVTAAAVAQVGKVVTPDPVASASALAEVVPLVVEQYGGAAASLAADYYEDLRDLAPNVTSLFRADPVVRVRKKAVGWAAGWALEPLRELQRDVARELDVELGRTQARLAEVVQLEVARSFRETVRDNSFRDDDAVGWTRIARPDGCPFCRMLADRGAVYDKESARFAAHPDCNCTARAAFKGDPGPEWDVMQYVASQRKRTPEQQVALKQYLHDNFGGPKPTYIRDGGDVVPISRATGPVGFDSLTRDQIELQIRIAEGLKPSEWRTRQLGRLRERLAHL